MAHSCVSTSAASLRRHPLAFSSASPSSLLETQTLALLPFHSLGARDLRKIVGNRKNVRNFSVKAIYSGEFRKTERSARLGVWSIRDDVETPSSPYFPAIGQGEGPPPMGQGQFEGMFFRQRIIRLGGEVNDEMANFIVAQLLYLDVDDPNKDIVLYVNSPGGSVSAGMAIFDTMRHVRPDVSTVCAGLAASMGAFLLSAGTKGKRYSLPSSRIMIHQPLGGIQGHLSDMEVQADEMLYYKANLAGHLAKMTGKSVGTIHQDTDRDYFLSPREAQAYGLIDGIIMNPLKPRLSAAAIADR